MVSHVQFSASLTNHQCLELADRWNKARNDDLSQFSPKDVADFSSTQLCVFLDKLGEDKPYLPATVQTLDKLYSLDKSENSEIKLRFFKIALQSGPEYAQHAAGMWLKVAPSKWRIGDVCLTLRLGHYQGSHEVLSCKSNKRPWRPSGVHSLQGSDHWLRRYENEMS